MVQYLTINENSREGCGGDAEVRKGPLHRGTNLGNRGKRRQGDFGEWEIIPNEATGIGKGIEHHGKDQET